MNRAQAIAKLRRLLGVHFGWREDAGALVGDAREQAREEYRAARAAAEIAANAVEARRAAVLAADADYQSLKLACKNLRATADKLGGLAHRRRITVGTANSIFFTVKAEGDNWQDVVDQLTKVQS